MFGLGWRIGVAIPYGGTVHGQRPVDHRERFPADTVQVKIVDSALRQVALRISKHHEGNASLLAEASVGMAKIGIKINGIARTHEMLVAPKQETQRATHNVDELKAQVRMGFGVLFR
jgi:hypothetical protein